MTDASPRDTRPLTLVKEFNGSASQRQWGYQKLDDLTVLHRRGVPVYVNSANDATWNIEITLYDFNSYQVTTTIQPLASSSVAPIAFSRSFSEIEGKQAIRDAHRALCELDGKPPALDEIMGFVMELKKNVPVSAPLKLKTAEI